MEKEDVYIVYQCGYCEGSNFMEILGVYKNARFAEEKYFNEINENIKDYDFSPDEECNDIVAETSRETRLFKGGYQENWDNYIEFHISKEEVK